MDMEDDHDDNPPYFAHRKFSYNVNSRLMLTAIISLSLVVVFVAMLHVYARCVLRRRSRLRQARLSQLGLTITTTARVHAVEAPKKGLDPSTISLLPLIIYSNRDQDPQDLAGYNDSKGSTRECSVCLSVFENGDMVRVLPNCNHSFHADCIDKWLCSTSTCPVCRTEAQPRLAPEAREPMVVVLLPPSDPLQDAEGTSSDDTNQSSAKVNESSSRLSSFRRMLSRDRPSQRIQSRGQDGFDDLERQ